MKKGLLYIILLVFTVCCRRVENKEAGEGKRIACPGNEEIVRIKSSNKMLAAGRNEKNEKRKKYSVHCITRLGREKAFYLYYSKKRDCISPDSILIQNKAGEKIIQKIVLDPSKFEWLGSEPYFSVDADINFDGYNDIQLSNYIGMYTYSYNFWVFDKRKNYYRHVKELDDVYNPQTDQKRKEVISQWHAGMFEFHYDTYGWKNGQLIVKEKLEDTVPVMPIPETRSDSTGR